MNAADPFFGRQPSRFLLDVLGQMPDGGLVLDLGAGEGRNAIFLAERGFRVIAVDVAVAGLARARAAASQRGVRLDLVVADLIGGDPLRLGNRKVDVILVGNFHDRGAVASAASRLKPGGVVLVEGFAREQLGRSSGGPQDPAVLWGPNELLELAGCLRVLHYEDREVEDDDNPRHPGRRWVVRLLARLEANGR